MEPYSFQNVYLITTYRCNWKCDFCLFRFNKEIEAPIDDILHRLDFSIKNSADRVYLKITGGEPFLRPSLLRAVFELCEEHGDKIYKVGIGTNGSIRLPAFFNSVKVRTDIFLSRHNPLADTLPTPKQLSDHINNSFIDFKFNCNLIRGGIDSVAKIKDYIRKTTDVQSICFRELSKVSVDDNLMYPSQVYDYIEYYKKNVVLVLDIIEEIKNDINFIPTRKVGNYYDTNYWYYFENGMSIKFRTIDECKLIEYNTEVNPDHVDEFVIHPDGTLTGCWDKDLKLIMKGGEDHAKSSICAQT